MKKLFRGYYKLNQAEIQNIWNNGFISIDTNVLFNLYRYSDETRKELIRVINSYSSRLWLTHHSAFEFHKNRVTVISEQIVTYDKTIKEFNELENDIVKNLKSPHLSKSILKQFEKVIKTANKDFEKRKGFYKKLLDNDTILNTISKIFDNKIGNPFTSDEILKIEKDGEDRYKRKIPPGFKDNDKTENKFGDLIIWKELIRKAKEDGKPFIFIIDDMKEDWWLRIQGKTISPRQELAQELYKETSQLFHLYTPDRFLEFAAQTGKIKQETIDEVREIRTDKSSIYKHSDYSSEFYPKSSWSDILKANSDTSENISNVNSLFELSKNIKIPTALMNLSKRLEPNPLSQLLKSQEIYSKLNTLQTIINQSRDAKIFFNSSNEEAGDNEQ